MFFKKAGLSHTIATNTQSEYIFEKKNKYVLLFSLPRSNIGFYICLDRFTFCLSLGWSGHFFCVVSFPRAPWKITQPQDQQMERLHKKNMIQGS